LRFQAATAAACEDLDIVAAGLHPFSRWEGQRMTVGERYARMANEYGRIARDEHNFGMHIHVAVPATLERIPLLNAVRPYIPHLLALSSSSPFYEGDDTGFASFRMILWRRWPAAGIPPRLTNDAEYRHYVAALLRAGALGDERNLYWTIRLHPEYPTLEFRMCDVCPSVEDAVAIAALARTLVAAAAQGKLPDREKDALSESAHDALLADDLWRVSRHGLEAPLVNTRAASDFVTARDAIKRLIDAVGPSAQLIGEDEALAGTETILTRGSGADRMRAFVRDHDLFTLVQWLRAETLAGSGLSGVLSDHDGDSAVRAESA
jgi:carboxylate-amine ligase